VVAAAVLVGGVWGLMQTGWYPHRQITDYGVYSQYGDRIVHGHDVPYRDFTLEYPPAALPVFVAPALLERYDYNRVFQVLMALCDLGAVLAVWLVAGRRAAAIAAVAPLALGSVVLSRFDFWPTALAALGLAALLRGRSTTSALLLGTAFAAKLWPAALAPLVVIWRDRGGVVPSVRRPLPRRRRARFPLAVRATAAARESRRLAADRGSRGCRDDAARHLELRVAESQRAWDTCGGRRDDDRGRGLPGRGLGSLRARAGHRRAVRRLCSGRGCGARRLRQGVLAAVPDLADSPRAARARTPVARRSTALRSSARPHAALVPLSLLGARSALRLAVLVAPARPRSRGRCTPLRARLAPVTARAARGKPLPTRSAPTRTGSGRVMTRRGG